MFRQENVSSVSVIKGHVGYPTRSLVLYNWLSHLKTARKLHKHKERRAVPQVSETLQQSELEFCKTHRRKEKFTVEQAHEGPEWEKLYSSTLSLTSALDGGG
jgi:hypothetical protein